MLVCGLVLSVRASVACVCVELYDGSCAVTSRLMRVCLELCDGSCAVKFVVEGKVLYNTILLFQQ
eukprot:m.61939 g.61939  ORF g.61939 m.61939 type:complete len:65 (-) comp23061_c0_seq1:156-350(-)